MIREQYMNKSLKRSIFLLSLISFYLCGASSQAKLTTKNVPYQIDNENFEGYLAFNGTADKKPGLLVVHNWMGITAETKSKVDALAKLGYVVFAVDVYGKDIRPKDAQAAGTEAGKYKQNRVLLRERLKAGLEQLKKIKGIDQQKLAAIGYCFGGTAVLELARGGAPLKAVVSFHGGLDSPEPAIGKNITAKVLALHGADDPFEPAADLTAFENEMRTNKIDWQLIKYGNTVHSFTEKAAGSDNSKGAAYNADSDRRSWAAMKAFLTEAL